MQIMPGNARWATTAAQNTPEPAIFNKLQDEVIELARARHRYWLDSSKGDYPEDAKMLSRLATRAVEEAKAFGIHIDHKEGLRRARANLAFVKAMYRARRTEWSS